MITKIRKIIKKFRTPIVKIYTIVRYGYNPKIHNQNDNYQLLSYFGLYEITLFDGIRQNLILDDTQAYIKVPPYSKVLVPTGIILKFHDDIEAMVIPYDYEVLLKGCIGIPQIINSKTKEIKIQILNISSKCVVIPKGLILANLKFQKTVGIKITKIPTHTLNIQK